MTPPTPGFHWRIWAAEAVGTALLVLAIVAAVALALGDGSPVGDALPGRGAGFLVVGAIVAPCIALIAVSPLGRLSGAHLNPAVTVGFWMLGRVCRHDLVGYVVAQLVGGLTGAYAARLVLPASVTASIGGAVIHPGVPIAAAVALEAGMTALLLAVVFLFVSVERLALWTPLALVPLLTAIIWLGSPWTGASLNPARSEGPALAFRDLADLWLYLLAPILGALAVALVWRRLSMRPKTAKLFHDPRYPCTFATELAPVTDRGPARAASARASGRSPAASEGAVCVRLDRANGQEVVAASDPNSFRERRRQRLGLRRDGRIDPDRELVPRGETLERRDLRCPVARRVLHLREADLRGRPRPGEEPTLEVRGGRRRDDAFHQIRGVVDEHPGSRPVAASNDPAADRVGSVGADLRLFESERVDPHRVTVDAARDDRSVGDDRVQIARVRKGLAGPQVLVPAAPFHPRTRGEPRRQGSDPSSGVRRRRRAPEVGDLERFPETVEMRVRIRPAGKGDRAAVSDSPQPVAPSHAHTRVL